MKTETFMLDGYPIRGFEKATQKAWDEMYRKYFNAKKTDIGKFEVKNLWLETFAFDRLDVSDDQCLKRHRIETIEEFRKFFRSLQPKSQYVRLQIESDGKGSYGGYCDLGTKLACDAAAEAVFQSIQDDLPEGETSTIHLLSGQRRTLTGTVKS